MVVDAILLVVAVVLGQESAILLALTCLLGALRHILNDCWLVIGKKLLTHFVKALAVAFHDFVTKIGERDLDTAALLILQILRYVLREMFLEDLVV